jgi:hypothetical protein
MIRHLLVIAAAAALSACATAPPPYAAASAQGAAGYSEQQIESNRYFVTYRASGAADAGLLRDYAMLRAADIAVQRGAPWFHVDRTSIEPTSVRSGPSIGIGIGGASFGRHSAIGTSVGFNFPLGSSSGEQARAATVEMRLGEGPKPDDVNAYDARSTAETIRARVATPR